jgi:hypothetical protein
VILYTAVSDSWVFSISRSIWNPFLFNNVTIFFYHTTN